MARLSIGFVSLGPSLGLDEARIDTGSSRNKAQLVVGKYLSPRLYVGYGIGIYEPIMSMNPFNPMH